MSNTHEVKRKRIAALVEKDLAAHWGKLRCRLAKSSMIPSVGGIGTTRFEVYLTTNNQYIG